MVFPASGRRLVLGALCVALLAGCGDSPEAMVESARQYLAKNDLNAASIQLKNALQENGKLAEARFLLGTVNLQQGNLTGAVKELRRAGELGFPAAQVSPPLARAMVQLGEFDQVLKEFEGTSLEDPTAQALVLGAVGDAHLGRKNTANAKAAFEAALSANPMDASSKIGLGRTQLIAADLDGAMAAADAVLAARPGGRDEAEAHVLRADVLLARKQVGEAIDALGAAVKARPSAINYHFVLISLLLQKGDFEAVGPRLEAMRKVAPAHPLTRYLQAMVEFRDGKLSVAREHISETVRLTPDFLPGRVLAGMIHARLNEHVLAQEHLAAVVGRAPGQTVARRALAQSQLASGEPLSALETLDPLLEADAPDVETLKLAGQIYAANGDIEKASENFSRVAAARPDDAVARMQLGISRLFAGDSVDAMSDLEAASQFSTSVGEADVALILVHLRRGELDKALAAQRRLESKQPDSPQTYTLKGGILAAKKDLTGARAALEKALALKADHLPAALSLSRMDLMEKRPQDAVKRFEAIIAANPKRIQAYLLLADLLVSTGAKPEAVREVLERATRSDPAAVAPKLALVHHDLEQRDTKKALAMVQEVAAAHPNDPRVLRMLGRSQFAAGDQQQAIAAFSKQVGLLPQAVSPLIELADAQRLTKDRVGAEQSLKRALSLKPDFVDAQRRLVLLYLEDKRTNDALEIARTVQKQRPKMSTGWALEGDIHILTKNWALALPAFRKALDLEKTSEVAIKLYATQMHSGKSADAVKTVSDWLRANPNDIKMRAFLADRALTERRLDDAEKLYRKMNEIKPDAPLVINNLAWIAGQRKDPQALALAERALRLSPDNPAVLDTLGMLQVEFGQAEKGVENLRRAVSLAPTGWAMRVNLAKTYVRLGRKDEARQEVTTLLEKLPADSPHRTELGALKDKL
nr:XrtA/PEP-CTERM system TPR-repeat protein PrsT [Aromatoleum diolicum]